MTQSRKSVQSRSAVFQAAARIMLRVFVCDIEDDSSATEAVDQVTSCCDVDSGLEDIGLSPVEFARDTLSADEVGEIVLRSSADIEQLVEEVGGTPIASELFGELEQLIEQLDLIGIPEWAGAEGLDLSTARDALGRHRAYCTSVDVRPNS